MSMRRSMLADTAASMQLDMMQSFGQSEALTTRLKHIIDAYADGPGILLELVQNAGECLTVRPLVGALPFSHEAGMRCLYRPKLQYKPSQIMYLAC